MQLFRSNCYGMETTQNASGGRRHELCSGDNIVMTMLIQKAIINLYPIMVWHTHTSVWATGFNLGCVFNPPNFVRAKKLIIEFILVV